MPEETSQRSKDSEQHPIERHPNLLSPDSIGQDPSGTFPDQINNNGASPQMGGPGQAGQQYSNGAPNGLSNGASYNAPAYDPIRNTNPEESPDLLRWRADSLLDEMTMGGVDGSAVQQTGAQRSVGGVENRGAQSAAYSTSSSDEADWYDYGDGPAYDGSPSQPSQPYPHHPTPSPSAPSHSADMPPAQVASSVPYDSGTLPSHQASAPTSASGLTGSSAPLNSEAQPAQYFPGQPTNFAHGVEPHPPSTYPGQQVQPAQPPSPPEVGYEVPPQSNLRQPTAAPPHMQHGSINPGGMSHDSINQGQALSGQPQNYGDGYDYPPAQVPPAAHPYPPSQSTYAHSAQPHPNQAQPSQWANQPSFEQGHLPRLDSGLEQRGLEQRGYEQSRYDDLGGGQFLYEQPQHGQGSIQDRNQQPLDPATFYAQQIAWKREQERKQWAISSGSSSDYLTSVPRYEEAQNRTASYMDRLGAPATWQQPDNRYRSDYPQQSYEPTGYQPNGYSQEGYDQSGYDQSGYNQNSYDQSGIHANPNYSPSLGPVNPGYGAGQQSANMPFAERMDVGVQAQRRSNLLPRRTQLSVDALYEEMTVLQSQVDAALPIYGDSADRALHLLEKGRTILEQSPDRSAEVAYYVQQVSGIIQRGQQRLEWSNMYRSRLSRYLTAWLLLGLLGIVGSLAYTGIIIDAFSGWFPFAAGFFANHLRAILLAISASILGSAFSALVNMWRHSQKEYGFFDRKYGLLGVLLPLMGLVVGLVIYFGLAIIYLFLNISPNSNWIAQALPALLAFVYAGSQERIYGTSE